MGYVDTAYNKEIKRHRATQGEISCSYCRYHRAENNGFGKYRPRPDKYKDKRIK